MLSVVYHSMWLKSMVKTGGKEKNFYRSYPDGGRLFSPPPHPALFRARAHAHTESAFSSLFLFFYLFFFLFFLLFLFCFFFLFRFSYSFSFLFSFFFSLFQAWQERYIRVTGSVTVTLRDALQERSESGKWKVELFRIKTILHSALKNTLPEFSPEDVKFL